MRTYLTRLDRTVPKTRETARTINPKISRGAFDAVAYAAALEVLG
jgi:hypothetical protein